MKDHKDTKNYYWERVPVFEKYKDRKVKEYCDDCGHLIGTHVEKVGVHLLGHEWKRFKKGPFYLMNKVMEKTLGQKIVDSVMNRSYFNGTGSKIKLPEIDSPTS